MQTLKTKDCIGVSVSNIPSQTNKLGYKMKRCRQQTNKWPCKKLTVFITDWVNLTSVKKLWIVKIVDHLDELSRPLGSARLVSKLRQSMSRNNAHIRNLYPKHTIIPNEDLITTYNLLATFEMSVRFYQTITNGFFSQQFRVYLFTFAWRIDQ